VAQASQQFDEDGQIISELYLESVKEAMRNLRKAMD
jgi:hypothetical protein